MLTRQIGTEASASGGVPGRAIGQESHTIPVTGRQLSQQMALTVGILQINNKVESGRAGRVTDHHSMPVMQHSMQLMMMMWISRRTC